MLNKNPISTDDFVLTDEQKKQIKAELIFNNLSMAVDALKRALEINYGADMIFPPLSAEVLCAVAPLSFRSMLHSLPPNHLVEYKDIENKELLQVEINVPDNWPDCLYPKLTEAVKKWMKEHSNES